MPVKLLVLIFAAVSTAVAQPPSVLVTPSITPINSGDIRPVFTLSATAASGHASDIGVVYLWIGNDGASVASSGGCFVVFVNGSPFSWYLNTDANTFALIGSSGGINTQCSVSPSITGTMGTGSISSQFQIFFQDGFTGLKRIYAAGYDTTGQSAGWQYQGTWTPAAVASLGAVSVVPLTGSGGISSPATFTTVYADPNSHSDLGVVYFEVGNTVFGTNNCIVAFVPASNQIYLFNDASTSGAGPISAIGTATLANSQCTVSGGGNSVPHNNNLNVPFKIQFASTYSGSHNIYGMAQNYAGTQSNWLELGTFNAQ